MQHRHVQRIGRQPCRRGEAVPVRAGLGDASATARNASSGRTGGSRRGRCGARSFSGRAARRRARRARRSWSPSCMALTNPICSAPAEIRAQAERPVFPRPVGADIPARPSPAQAACRSHHPRPAPGTGCWPDRKTRTCRPGRQIPPGRRPRRLLAAPSASSCGEQVERRPRCAGAAHILDGDDDSPGRRTRRDARTPGCEAIARP